jgi:DHA1 family bicyclomycin/chloramphenicol resistance-like MFS transporter
LSARADLAGAASGLGGALMMGAGAGLAALAGAVLHKGSGELPLVAVMLGSALASLACGVLARRLRP